MFKVRHTEETANRTFRFPKSLLDKMSAVAQNEKVQKVEVQLITTQH